LATERRAASESEEVPEPPVEEETLHLGPVLGVGFLGEELELARAWLSFLLGDLASEAESVGERNSFWIR
jgi:hypothetical protein